MKTIVLTQNKYTLVDDEDYEFLSQWKWCFSGKYAMRKENKKSIWMHRVINNTPDGMLTDHINMNKLDNRRSNLRMCNHRDNIHHKNRPRNNTSGYKGVSGRNNKWRAQIMVNGHYKYLGTYTSIIKAATVYDGTAKRNFGEFAVLNFPNQEPSNI